MPAIGELYFTGLYIQYHTGNCDRVTNMFDFIMYICYHYKRDIPFGMFTSDRNSLKIYWQIAALILSIPRYNILFQGLSDNINVYLSPIARSEHHLCMADVIIYGFPIV